MKRILAMAISVVLIATMAIGGSIAYLTDTDEDVNVMVVGNVDITMHEKQRTEEAYMNAKAIGEDGLTDYVNGLPLYPAVPVKAGAYTAAQNQGDDFYYFWGDYVTADVDFVTNPNGAGNGLFDNTKLKGVQDKFVFVENNGKSDAYYRTIFAFELEGETAPSILNDKNDYIYLNTNYNDRFSWESIGNIEIDGVWYELVECIYEKELLKNTMSRPSLLQVVMRDNATNEDVAKYGDTYDVLVYTQAVQTENFKDIPAADLGGKTSAEYALDAAFYDVTTTNHPWINGVSGAPILVTSAAELQAALDNATGDANIVLAADITGDVIVTQKEGVNITINGQGNDYTGTIEIYGQARHNGAETLTIKNIDFVTTETIDFITCNTTDSVKRYAHNVTIENCTFTGTYDDGKEAVGARFRQCYNITMKDCTVKNMHSVMWATGCNMVTCDNVTTIDCGNGISTGTSTPVTIKNCNISATAYGIRADGGNYTLTAENNTINAKQPIIIRNLKANGYTLNLSGNTLTPATAGDYQVILTTGSDEATYVAPTVSYTLNGAEELTVFK